MGAEYYNRSKFAHQNCIALTSSTLAKYSQRVKLLPLETILVTEQPPPPNSQLSPVDR